TRSMSIKWVEILLNKYIHHSPEDAAQAIIECFDSELASGMEVYDYDFVGDRSLIYFEAHGDKYKIDCSGWVSVEVYDENMESSVVYESTASELAENIEDAQLL
ncbi:MAG TPA: hypothetical protein VIH12_08605, partial [Solibacillus sp.]